MYSHLCFSILGRLALIPTDVPDGKVVSVRYGIDFNFAVAEQLIANFVSITVYHAYISSPYSSIFAQASEYKSACARSPHHASFTVLSVVSIHTDGPPTATQILTPLYSLSEVITYSIS